MRVVTWREGVLSWRFRGPNYWGSVDEGMCLECGVWSERSVNRLLRS